MAMKKGFVLFALFTVMAACSPPENASQEQSSLLSTLEVFNKAFERGDLITLDSLTTDNYIHTNGQSKAFSKEAWFKYLQGRKKDLESGKLMIKRYELTEEKVTMYGTTAIFTGLITTAGIQDATSFERQLRVTNLWVKEGGTWKRAGFHDTRVQ